MKPIPQLLTMKSYFVHPDGKIIDCKADHEIYLEKQQSTKLAWKKLIKLLDFDKSWLAEENRLHSTLFEIIEEMLILGWFSIFTTGVSEMAIRGFNITPAKLEKLELVLLKHDLISDEVRIDDLNTDQKAYFYTRKVKGFADAWRRRIKLNFEGDNMLKKTRKKNPFTVGTSKWGKLDDASKKGDAGAFVDVEIRPAVEEINVEEYKAEHPGKNSLCITVNQLLNLAFESLEDAEPIEGDPTHFMYKGTKLS